MGKVKFKGAPVQLEGTLPEVGKQVKDFVLVAADLADKRLKDLSGRKVVIATVPSLDTPVCLLSAKKLNEKAAAGNMDVYFVSADLPFAQKRACGLENLSHVHTLSMMRSKDFGKDYGLLIAEGPLKGLLARSCIVIDEHGKVIYFELVDEITHEMNYDALYKALNL